MCHRRVNRAEVVRLNAHRWYVEAAHFNWTPQVREVLHKWQKLGLEGLWELPGKTKYKEEDIVFLEECLKKNLVHTTVFN